MYRWVQWRPVVRCFPVVAGRFCTALPTTDAEEAGVARESVVAAPTGNHHTISGILYTGQQLRRMQQEASQRGFSSTVWLTEKQGAVCGTTLRKDAGEGVQKFLWGKAITMYCADQFENPELCTVDRFKRVNEEAFQAKKMQERGAGGGVGRLSKPHSIQLSAEGKPFPPIIGRLLDHAAKVKQYNSLHWYTRRQIEQSGRQLKGGAHGVRVPLKAKSSDSSVDMDHILLYNEDEIMTSGQ